MDISSQGLDSPQEVTAQEVIEKLKNLGADNPEAKELLCKWIDGLHEGEKERIKEKAIAQARMEMENVRRAKERELDRPLNAAEEIWIAEELYNRKEKIETVVSLKEALLVNLKIADLYIKAGYNEAALELLKDSGKPYPGDPDDYEIGAIIIAEKLGDTTLIEAVEALLKKTDSTK